MSNYQQQLDELGAQLSRTNDPQRAEYIMHEMEAVNDRLQTERDDIAKAKAKGLIESNEIDIPEGKRLTELEDVKTYLDGQRGTFTIRSKKTRVRFTFKFAVPKENEQNIRFVRVLNGPDNETCYGYIGYIRDGKLIAGRKGKADAPSFKALAWVLCHNAHDNLETVLEQMEFFHEGTCSQCGRKLTVPESIERGIGPVCAKHHHDHRHTH